MASPLAAGLFHRAIGSSGGSFGPTSEGGTHFGGCFQSLAAAERSGEQGVPRVEKLSPREALLELLKNTYMNWVLDREQRAKEFEALCRVVQQVPVRRLVPHSNAEKITGLCELILQDAGAALSSSTIR